MERGHPVFKAFQSLLRKRQILIVFLTRTAFFPIAMKNYGLSVLDVRFSVYFAAALLTGIPFSVIWVYSGTAAQHLTTLLTEKNNSHQRTEAVMLVVGALSALALLAFIGFYTRQQIMAMAEEEKKQTLEAARKDLPLRPSRTLRSSSSSSSSSSDDSSYESDHAPSPRRTTSPKASINLLV
ncbi:hypothetical protein PINS_up013873 [Pythium insidiosum]|nr:hypothetical protein PINS_up013873 [Pythium insidiosum]